MIEHIETLLGAGFTLKFSDSAKNEIDFDTFSKTISEGSTVKMALGAENRVGGRYIHAVNMTVRSRVHAATAHKIMHERFPELDFAKLPALQIGEASAGRQYIVALDEPFASTAVAVSGIKVPVGQDRKPGWQIEIRGNEGTAPLPPLMVGKMPLQWANPPRFLDAINLPASALRRALGTTQEGEAAGVVRYPRLGLTVEQALADLNDAPASFIADEWVGITSALYHEFAGGRDAFEALIDLAVPAGCDLARLESLWHELRGESGDTWAALRATIGERFGFEAMRDGVEAAQDYETAVLAASRYRVGTVRTQALATALIDKAEIAGYGRPTRGTVEREIRQTIEAREREAEGLAGPIESAIADEVLRIHYAGGRDLIRYAKTNWIYRTGRWRMVNDEAISNRILETLTQLRFLRIGERSHGLRQRLEASNRDNYEAQLRSAVLAAIQAKCSRDEQEDPLRLTQGSDQPVFNVRNGELHLVNGRFVLRPHRAENMFITQLQAAYDPQAKCPRFDALMGELFPEDPDTQRHALECFAYVAQLSRQFETWLMFKGEGGNGKSTLIKIMAKLIGPGGVVTKRLADFDSERNSHSTFGLVGKLMAWEDDFEKGKMLPSGALKKLANPDQDYTVNPKGRDELNIISRAVPVISTNAWPETNDNSHGMGRRPQVFHLRSTFGHNKADPSLVKTIVRSELPGILNRLVAAAEELFKRKRFEPSEACESAKGEWLGNRNMTAAFIAEAFEVTRDLKDEIQGSDANTLYQAFVARNAVQKVLSNRTLYNELAGVPGVHRVTLNNQVAFRGLRVRPG